MGVRRAAEGDLDIVHPLLEQLMPAELERRHAAWTKALADEGYAAWIAEVDGEPGGFIDLYFFPDVAHGGTIGLINNLVVDERFRGRGLGGSLLQAAIQHCAQRGGLELHVWTDFDNAPAIGVYKGVGFKERALLLELQA